MPLWFVTARLRDQKTGKLLYVEQFVRTAPGIEMVQRSVVEDWSYVFPATDGISLDREYYEGFTMRAVTQMEMEGWYLQHPHGFGWRWLEEDTPSN